MDASTSGALGELPPYSVRCIDVDPVAEADGHYHVVAIETSDPDGGVTRWSLIQVISAVRDGERFKLDAGDGVQAVELEPAVCPRCSMATLTPAGPSDAGVEPCS